MVYIYMKHLHCIANLFNVHQLEIITSLGEFKFKYLLITNFTACTHLNVQVLHYLWCGQSNKDRMTGNFSLFLPHLDQSLIIIMLEFPIQFLYIALSHVYPYTDGLHPNFFIQHCTFRALPVCLISLKIYCICI